MGLLVVLVACKSNEFYQKPKKKTKVEQYIHHYYCIETYHDNWYVKEQMKGRNLKK